jgi:hypothetical protein
MDQKVKICGENIIFLRMRCLKNSRLFDFISQSLLCVKKKNRLSEWSRARRCWKAAKRLSADSHLQSSAGQI